MTNFFGTYTNYLRRTHINPGAMHLNLESENSEDGDVETPSQGEPSNRDESFLQKINWVDILPFMVMSAFFGWLALFWFFAGYGLWCVLTQLFGG